MTNALFWMLLLCFAAFVLYIFWPPHGLLG